MLIIGCGILGCGSVGCDIPDRPPLLSDKSVGRKLSPEQLAELDEQARRQSPQPPLAESSPAAPSVGTSRWYAVETPAVAAAGKQTVGRRHVRVSKPSESEIAAATAAGIAAALESQDPVSVEQLDELWVGQNDCSIVSSIRIIETMTADGQLLMIQKQRGFGPLIDRSVAVVDAGKLTFQPSEPNDFPPRIVPAAVGWSDRDRGELAYRQALGEMSAAMESMDQGSRQQIIPREMMAPLPSPHRQIRTIKRDGSAGDPITPSGGDSGGGNSGGGDIGESSVAMSLRLANQRQTSVPMFDGTSRRLDEFTVNWIRADKPVQQIVAWLDQSVIARMLRADGLIDVLVPSEDQISTPPRPPGDAAVRVSGKTFDSAATLIAMRIDCPDGVLKAAPGQQIRRLRIGDAVDPDQLETVDILAAAVGERSAVGFVSYESPPQPADTAASKLIDFGQDSLTRVIGATKVGVNPGDAAMATDQSVENIVSTARSLITPQPLDYTYRPAGVVINEGSAGPISESILLAALLRGNGIPTRIAMGLRGAQAFPEKMLAVSPNDKRQKYWGWMGFDVWVIAFWEDAWHNVDLGSKQFPMPVFRITLSICQPDPTSIDESLQRTIQTMSKLKIQVAGVR